MIATGTDILHIPRLQRALDHYGAAFLRRVFTVAEVAYCAGRVQPLAARFAAKEAASKALGVGMRVMSEFGIGWYEAEVLNDDKGRPVLYLHGRAAALAHELHWRVWSLSLAHEREYAIATVVATGG